MALLLAAGGARGEEAPPPPARGASPRGALFRSTLVPGWGQKATGHPLKGAVFFSGAAALGAGVAVQTRRANQATESANDAVLRGDETAYDRYVGERDSHLASRDNLVSWLVLLWVYNMVDAYVEGHFVGFEGFRLETLPAAGGAAGTGSGIPIVRIRFHG